MSRFYQILLYTSIGSIAYYVLNDLYFYQLREALNSTIPSLSIRHIVAYIIVGIPVFISVFLLHSSTGFFSSLGLNKSILKGVFFSFICTVPMLVGYAIVFQWNAELSLNKIVIGSICAALFEELYFRGFLFGQIFRFTRIGFIPAIIIGALLFASVHLYQSQDPITIIGIFFTTFLGAIWFAWLYVEWDNNLWVPIFLHLFMNLVWMMFSVSDNAFGGNYANIFRLATIALSIVITILYKRNRGQKLAVNRKTVWMKSR
ncbi:MAG: type II CAAX endopeptidase family protein [Bacteroidota bacterium]